MKGNPHKYIFSEDIDYSQTPKQSIWGMGDPKTLDVLEKLVSKNKLSGEWLNFAAGDGRYNDILLREASHVTVTDIDKAALEKLRKVTPKDLQSRLLLKVQNITKRFPFEDNSFDGAFNTGTIYLFPEPILVSITREISRVLKPGGLFIFDFATDIERVTAGGKHLADSPVVYSKLGSRKLLSDLLGKQGFKTQFISCKVPPEKVTSGSGNYTFSCNFWLVIAEKL